MENLDIKRILLKIVIAKTKSVPEIKEEGIKLF